MLRGAHQKQASLGQLPRQRVVLFHMSYSAHVQTHESEVSRVAALLAATYTFFLRGRGFVLQQCSGSGGTKRGAATAS